MSYTAKEIVDMRQAVLALKEQTRLEGGAGSWSPLSEEQVERELLTYMSNGTRVKELRKLYDKNERERIRKWEATLP